MPKRGRSSRIVRNIRSRSRLAISRAKRRKTTRRRGVRLNRTSLGMPKVFKTRLRYVSEVALDPTTTSVVQVFRANDLYDPDYSAGGHQPRGFDELCQFYHRFTVIGSKINVKQVIMPGTALSTAEPMYWGVNVTRTPTELSGLLQTDLIERTRSFKMGGNFFNTTTQTQNKSAKFSTKKHFASKAVVGDNAYYNTSSASPSNVGYYTLWAASCMGNNPGQQFFIVEIEYIVVCHVYTDDQAQS